MTWIRGLSVLCLEEGGSAAGAGVSAGAVAVASYVLSVVAIKIIGFRSDISINLVMDLRDAPAYDVGALRTLLLY